MKEFEPKFREFVKETEFGTSAYLVCYKAGLVDRDIKDFIIKMKFDKTEDLQTLAYEHIPPLQMEKLRDLVEENLYLVEKIFAEED